MSNETEKSLNDNIEYNQPTTDQIYNTATLLCQEEQIDPFILEQSIKTFGDNYEDIEQLVLLSHIIPLVTQNPTTPVKDLELNPNITREELLNTYRWIQSSNMLKTIMTSHYYPGYMMIRYAQTFLKDLAKDSQYLKDVIEQKPLLFRGS